MDPAVQRLVLTRMFEAMTERSARLMQVDVRFDAADRRMIFDGDTAHYTFAGDTLVVSADADQGRFEKLALHDVQEESSEDRTGGWRCTAEVRVGWPSAARAVRYEALIRDDGELAVYGSVGTGADRVTF